MKRQSVRVIIASEHPSVRHFLRGAVEEQSGAVVIGQAENAARALALARSLRPDVAVIDCYLPHAIGLDNVPLTRTAGLDAAWSISEEIPNTRVVLVNNLDTGVLDSDAFICRQSVPFSIQELSQKSEFVIPPVFASICVRTQKPLAQRIARTGDRAIFFGSMGVLGGLCLMLTIVFAPGGIALAVGGLATMLLGLVAKLVAQKQSIR